MTLIISGFTKLLLVNAALAVGPEPPSAGVPDPAGAGVLPAVDPHAAAPASPAADPAAKEREGDGWREASDPFYRQAIKALDIGGRLSEKAGDPPGAARAAAISAAILVNLLDARAFVSAAEASGAAIAPRPLPLSIIEPAAGDPGEGDLKALSTFLAEAGRAYLTAPDREVRDLPLIFEALALVERMSADIRLARADAAYREALAALEPAGGAPPAAESDRRIAIARLRYKLRDLDGARAALEGIDGKALAGPGQIELARLGRDLARFAGARAQALAMEVRLKDLGDKAEETPLPVAGSPALLRGAPADLARTAGTLLALVRARRLPDRDRLLAEFLAGGAVLEAGEPAAAAEVLEAALTRRSAQGTGDVPLGAEGDPWLAAGAAARLGTARDRSGDLEGAAAAYRRALDALAGLPGAARFRTRISIDLAAALFGLGQLEEARRGALALLDEKEIEADLRVRCRILLAGILYASADGSRDGLNDTLATLALAEKERRDEGIAPAVAEELRVLILIHVGNVRRRLAMAAEEAGYRPERTRSGGSAPGAGKVDPAAERKEAALCAARALEAARAGGSALERLAAAASANLGEIEIEAGDLAAGRGHVAWALERAVALRSFETEWRCRWYLARILDAEGKAAAADAEMEAAARIVEAHRSRIVAADRKAGFMASKVGLYEAMVRRALARGDGAGAFAAAERSRARAFIESLGLRFLLLGADEERRLYREYIGLLSRTEEKATGAGALFGVRDGGAYEEFRAKLEALREKIRKSPLASPVLRALVDGDPSDLAAVQGLLSPGERLVEFFGMEGSAAAFVASRSSFRALVLGTPRREIEAGARKFAETGAADGALADFLGEALLAPVLAAIAAEPPEAGAGGESGAVPTLVIVPWGELHRIPFEALRVRGRFLIQDAAVAYLPTASVLRYLPRASGKEGPRKLIALVDPSTDYSGDGKPLLPPLRGARLEVDGIAPLFPEAQVLAGKEATESACLRLAPGREVVHLACHGEFFPARPLDSRLYLARDASGDGVLRVVDIYGVDLRGSRLVALSGCETGRSEVGAAEDPVGIGTAFLHAGAGSLLVSLWKVEDRATAELMGTFYRKWIGTGGSSGARALREAKLAMIEKESRTSPRDWAAFVLVGSR